MKIEISKEAYTRDQKICEEFAKNPPLAIILPLIDCLHTQPWDTEIDLLGELDENYTPQIKYRFRRNIYHTPPTFEETQEYEQANQELLRAQRGEINQPKTDLENAVAGLRECMDFFTARHARQWPNEMSVDELLMYRTGKKGYGAIVSKVDKLEATTRAFQGQQYLSGLWRRASDYKQERFATSITLMYRKGIDYAVAALTVQAARFDGVEAWTTGMAGVAHIISINQRKIVTGIGIKDKTLYLNEIGLGREVHPVEKEEIAPLIKFPNAS